MSRIICIADWFDVINRGINTGRKEYVVSHGIDEDTGRHVILPSEHPSKLGAKIDPEINEWVIE